MPLMHPDNWTVGPVRIRAKAIDPYAGLRGRDYIAARNLNSSVERLDAKQVQAVQQLQERRTTRPALYIVQSTRLA